MTEEATPFVMLHNFVDVIFCLALRVLHTVFLNACVTVIKYYFTGVQLCILLLIHLSRVFKFNCCWWQLFTAFL